MGVYVCDPSPQNAPMILRVDVPNPEGEAYHGLQSVPQVAALQSIQQVLEALPEGERHLNGLPVNPGMVGMITFNPEVYIYSPTMSYQLPVDMIKWVLGEERIDTIPFRAPQGNALILPLEAMPHALELLRQPGRLGDMQLARKFDECEHTYPIDPYFLPQWQDAITQEVGRVMSERAEIPARTRREHPPAAEREVRQESWERGSYLNFGRADADDVSPGASAQVRDILRGRQNNLGPLEEGWGPEN